MKQVFSLTILAWLATVSPSLATHYQVYLLGGQSNGNGRADAAPLTPPLSQEQTDVRLYYLNNQDENSVLPEEQWINLAPGSGHGSTLYYPVEFGPEVSFGRAMADAKPTENIAIIKYTYGGSSIGQWSATGARYLTFKSTVQNALTALTAAGDTYVLRGMLWQQGEADTGGAADNYQINLTNFIAQVRTDFNGGVAFPFVIGSLSDSQYSNITTVGSGPYKVRQAQEAVAAADPTAGIAISDGFGIQSDGIHFDHNGQVALGQGHATQMLLLEGPDETEPQLSGTTPADGVLTAPVDGNLVATFNEPIQLVDGGTVTIRDLGPGDDTVITIPDGRVTASGNEVVIDPATDLVAGNPYAIQISATAVEDLASNPFEGIGDDSNWNFTTAATPVTTNLIHHWPLDGNATDSTGTHHGTTQGDASYTTGTSGKFGEALTLDGAGDYVQIGQSSLPETDFSLTAWIYRETAGDYMYIAGTQNSGNSGAFMRMDSAIGDGQLFANLLPPATSQRIWGGTVALNEWTHVAMTVSSTAGLEIFINGASVGTDVTATTHDVWTNFRIGARPDGNAYYFDGLIDDVAVFDGVLTSTQLGNVIASGAANFDEVAGDTDPPEVLTLNPGDGGLNVAIDANLVITFNEPVAKGLSGEIVIKEDGGGVFETISVTDAKVGISGSVVTINPSGTFAINQGYHVQIADGAILDLSDNAWTGIAGTDTSTWNFATILAEDSAGTTGIFDENADATNELDVEIPASSLAAFKASVLAAYNNNLGGVIDWETGVTAVPSATTEPKNYLTSVAATYGTGGGNTLLLTFDRQMGMYTNDINGQVEVLSRNGAWHNSLVPDGGNAAIGLAYNVAFSGADVIELGMAMPSRSTYGALGVDFRATAAHSGGGSEVVDFTVGGTPSTGDTFLHFTAPEGQSITAVSVAYLDDNGQGLANGQRRPILDDLGFIVAAPSPENPYGEWAGGSTFSADDNGDGLENGLAWILGAANTTVSALDKLPAFSNPSGYLQLDFTRKNPYSPAMLYFEYSTDLTNWTSLELPADPGTSTVNDDIVITITAGPLDEIQVKIPTSYASGNGRLFTRLSATEN